MAKKSKGRREASMRALVLSSALGALAMVGMPAASLAQGKSAQEACAAVLTLRSPRVIENVLTNYASDPCVPLLLAALSAKDLSRISPELVAKLPRAQLRLVPSVVLEQLGLDGRLGDPHGVWAGQQGMSRGLSVQQPSELGGDPGGGSKPVNSRQY
jgi:hypothetical protein